MLKLIQNESNAFTYILLASDGKPFCLLGSFSVLHDCSFKWCFPNQAATAKNEKAFDIDDNTSEFLYKSLISNVKSCKPYDFSRLTYDFNSKRSFLLLHINISSLQDHIDELNDLFLNFTFPLSIIFVSNPFIINPQINIHISGYAFLHFSSPTKAGEVGAYVLKSLNIVENNSLRL